MVEQREGAVSDTKERRFREETQQEAQQVALRMLSEAGRD